MLIYFCITIPLVYGLLISYISYLYRSLYNKIIDLEYELKKWQIDNGKNN